MDINQCNLKLILGLIWTLILRYQIAGPVVPETPDKKSGKKGPSKEQKSAKKLLIQWVNVAIPGIKVANFSQSWNNGLALSALVDYCKPGLIPNHTSLDPNNGLENIKNAMDIAEKELGVPQVMHPEDMAVEKPDELSVMTYVSGYSHQDSAAQKSLLIWINCQMPHHQVTNLSSDWTDGKALGALTDVLSGGQLPEYEEMRAETALENCKIVMHRANKLLEIELLATPEEFSSQSLNQLTRISYLTQFQFCKPKLLADSLQVTGKGVTGDLVGQQTTFTVSAQRIPKWADIRATVSTPAGEKTQVNKERQDDKMAEFSYTPEEPGEYVIDIFMNSTPLPQQHAKHIIPTLASNCTASGEGLKRARVGQRAKFSVDCEQGGAGELHVIVQGPNNTLSVEIKEKKPQNFDVTYTPEEVDSHDISISWGNEQIPDSPFQCSVIDPSQCSVKGELSQATVNTRQVFVVDTSKAGPGELSVKCTGPKRSKLPVEIKNIGSNEMFECAWIPQEMGPHEIDITLSGHSIPKSPLLVNALRYADSKSCIVSELPKGDLYVRNTYSFTVSTQQPGYTCDLAILSTPKESLASCTVNGNQSTGVYTVTFSPVEVGDLALIVKCNGSAILTDKPLSFNVIDLSKPIKELCEFQAMENISETVNIPAEFLRNKVDFTEEDATLSTSEVVQDMVLEVNEPLILLIDMESDQIGRNITATITGQNTKPFSVPVTKKPDNSVTVRVSAKEPDRYTIALKVDGEPLPTHHFFVRFIEAVKIQGQTEKQTVTLQQPRQEERVMKLSYRYERKLINAQVSLSVDSSHVNASNTSVAILEGTTGHRIQPTLSQLEGGKYNIEFLPTNEREYVMKFEYRLKIAPIAQDKHYVLSSI